jgi:hypothetical protein
MFNQHSYFLVHFFIFTSKRARRVVHSPLSSHCIMYPRRILLAPVLLAASSKSWIPYVELSFEIEMQGFLAHQLYFLNLSLFPFPLAGEFVFAKSDVDGLLLPLLESLYSQRELRSNRVYMTLIVLLILSQVRHYQSEADTSLSFWFEHQCISASIFMIQYLAVSITGRLIF